MPFFRYSCQMVRYTILSALFLLFSIGTTAQYSQLSELSEISLITCGPGDELYSAFGHSAIRVQDPAHGDIVFNYGTFSFGQPNFYLRFAQGRLLYRLSIESFEGFHTFYMEENRSVIEQKLNLTLAQRQHLFELLMENYAPENREYPYHFFYDNCSSRIRDIVQKALNGKIDFKTTPIGNEPSFRDMTDVYLYNGNQYWGDFGIDLCLGLPTDNIASPWHQMFLPDYLMSYFGGAEIQTDSLPVPLVKETIVIYPVENRVFAKPLVTPAQVTWAIFIFIFAITIIRKKPIAFGWFDYILFGLIGLLGVGFALLWFATDHTDTKYNFNLLWALPTHLLLMPFYIKSLTFRKKYFAFTALIGLLLLMSWPILPQHLHHACIPITLLLTLRSYYLYRLKPMA